MRATLFRIVALSVTIAFLKSGFCCADIMFFDSGITTDENLQFNDALEKGPAITIQGQTQTSDTIIDITRIDADPILLYADAAGQARVEATATNDTDAAVTFTGADFESVAAVFSAFEFNADAAVDGTLKIIVEDFNGVIYSSDDDVSFDGSISGSGANRFGVTATSGMEMVRVTVQASGQILNDIQQVRLGGIVSATTFMTPEPSSIVLGGLALAMTVLFAVRTNRSTRKRKTVC